MDIIKYPVNQPDMINEEDFKITVTYVNSAQDASIKHDEHGDWHLQLNGKSIIKFELIGDKETDYIEKEKDHDLQTPTTEIVDALQHISEICH